MSEENLIERYVAIGVAVSDLGFSALSGSGLMYIHIKLSLTPQVKSLELEARHWVLGAL